MLTVGSFLVCTYRYVYTYIVPDELVKLNMKIKLLIYLKG